jgi:predicted nucleotidyltransferase
LATLQHAIQDDLRPHRLLQDQTDSIISKAHAAVTEMAAEVDADCRVVVVGSLVTGLATKKSDVDICLMTTMDTTVVSEQLLELFRKSPSFKAYVIGGV